MNIPTVVKIAAIYLAIQLCTMAVVLMYLTKEAERQLEAQAARSNSVIAEGLRASTSRLDSASSNIVAQAFQDAAPPRGKLVRIADSSTRASPPPDEGATARGDLRWGPVTTLLPFAGGTVTVVDQMDASDSVKRTMAWAFVGVAALGLEAGLVLAWLLLGTTKRQVAKLGAVITAVGDGDFSRKVDLGRSDGPFERLGADLNRTVNRLERLLIRLRSATDSVVHDVRSPVMRMRIFAEEALLSNDVESTRSSLEKVVEEAERMIRITANALQISRAEAGLDRDEFTLIDPAQVASQITGAYTSVADAHGVQLSTDLKPGLKMFASAELVAQALSNLIENVLRHGHSGGSCHVAVDADGDWVRIVVADRGPGIAAADRENALRRFGVVGSTGSTGLGLPLVAALVGLHEGAIKLEDRNPGLRVVIRLPQASRGALVSHPRSESVLERDGFIDRERDARERPSFAKRLRRWKRRHHVNNDIGAGEHRDLQRPGL